MNREIKNRVKSPSHWILCLGIILSLVSCENKVSSGNSSPGSSEVSGSAGQGAFKDYGWQEKASISVKKEITAEWDLDKKFDTVEVEIYEGTNCENLLFTFSGIKPELKKFTFSSGENDKFYTFKVIGLNKGKMSTSSCSGSIKVDFSASCDGNRLTNSPYANSGETGATGTTTAPFVICTASQLQALANTSADWSKNFVQGKTVNISSVSGSIGSLATPFSGSYNGGGFELTDFSIINSGLDEAGLFGVMGASGKISNLKLRNFFVRARYNVGILAGTSAGTIENVEIFSSTVNGENNVGGAVGYQSGGVMKSVVVTGSTTAGSSGWVAQIGGLVGQASGIIERSTVAGVVTGGYMRVGGLVGTCGCTINESSSSANVSIGTNVGGLVGELGGVIYKSYSTGNVSGGGSVGGLVGYVWNGAIHRSYYRGSTVTASGAGARAGGLIGAGYNGINIFNSYVIADTVQSASGHAAGFSGGGMTGNCYYSNSFAAVTTITGSLDVGGFVSTDDNGSGGLRCSHYGIAWDNVSGLTRSVGNHAGAITGINSYSTAVMKQTSTYLISNSWNILIWSLANGDYPTIFN